MELLGAKGVRSADVSESAITAPCPCYGHSSFTLERKRMNQPPTFMSPLISSCSYILAFRHGFQIPVFSTFSLMYDEHFLCLSLAPFPSIALTPYASDHGRLRSICCRVLRPQCLSQQGHQQHAEPGVERGVSAVRA